MSKRFIRLYLGAYKAEIQDYGYKNRPPVAVRVSGLRDGECKNMFGEPCYFYKSAEAMTIEDGIRQAKAIIAEQNNIGA